MRQLLAGGRVSLHRMRADWPIVAAAGLITLLATTLLAAGAIYPSAAAEAGLRRALADAPPNDANVEVALYGRAAEAGDLDALVQAELANVMSGVDGRVVRDWRDSATVALAGLPGSVDGDQAVLGYMDELSSHATLVEGAWPAAEAAASGTTEAVLLADVAVALGLHVGDDIPLVADASSDPVAIPVRLVGTFAPNSNADPFWRGDEQLLSGIRENSQYRTIGPLLMSRENLLRHAVSSIRLRWRTLLAFDRLTAGEVAPLRGRVEALRDRLRGAAGDPYEVQTGLPGFLRSAERSLLVSRTGVLLLMAQLAVLAAYAIVLTASLLVDHRRIDTALLRSRGSGPGQVAWLAVTEGLVLASPAVLVAPWLAVGALELLNVAGPLADVGLRIEPRVTADGYVAAAIAGIGCVALLALPAFLAGRRFAAEQSGLSRQETRTFGQRFGLDVTLLALTGIALWQLRFYGAPLTRTVQGSLGLDPLLVAAPAIGIVAGGVLALRILPLVAQVVESVVTRGRDLVISLGSRQLARRPLRYTRSALLLMLAMSMGVFALSYASTWSRSQRDQAAYQVGADVRVRPSQSFRALPSWALPRAYAALPGVDEAVPVEQRPKGVGLPFSTAADLLAIDTGTAAGILHLRGDEAGRPIAPMLEVLRAARPEPELPALPAGTTRLRVTPDLDLDAIAYFVEDPETGEITRVPLQPADLAQVRVGANVVVRDVHGLLYRLELPGEPVDVEGMVLEVVLEPTSAGNADAVAKAAVHLDGPLVLAGLGLAVWLPPGASMTGARIGIGDVEAGPDPGGPWTRVATGDAAWLARMAPGRDPLRGVPGIQVDGTTVDLIGGSQGSIRGAGPSRPGAQLAFLPASLGGEQGPVPVIANRAFLDATSSEAGEEIGATIDGASRRLSIAGVVETFPTTDPAVPLVVMDAQTLGLLRLQSTNAARPPDEWWLATAPGADAGIAGALRQAPYDSLRVVTLAERTRSLGSDPVALGIIGALALGFVATLLFAVIGLTVSGAVSARQRRTEYALLRALGISGRQLAGSLWLENGSVVLVSLLAGTSLGLVIAWAVLPFITVTQQAAAPIPPVIIQTPWDLILVLELASAVALVGAVVVIGTVLRRLGVGSILRMGED